MNSDTNLYPLQKSFGRFYCTEFFQMEKRGTKKQHCQLSIFKENTEAHNLLYFHLFFLSGLWGFGVFFFIPHFSLCSFEHHWFIFCTELHWFIFCTIMWVIRTSFSIYLGFDIFSSTEKLRWQWRPRRRQRQCRVR